MLYTVSTQVRFYETPIDEVAQSQRNLSIRSKVGTKHSGSSGDFEPFVSELLLRHISSRMNDEGVFHSRYTVYVRV